MQEYFELEFAKAKAKDAGPLWDDPRWIAEEKLDGWRFQMHYASDYERTYMTGRRTSSKTGQLSEKGLCAPCLWPTSTHTKLTVLDGEVMPPLGRSFRDLAGIMNVDPEKAARRIKEIGQPRYYVFDILWVDGQDVRDKPMWERRLALDYAILRAENKLIQLPPFYDTNTFKAYEDIVADGGEGVVLKDIYAPYGQGWVKVKKFTTHDVIVTGFTQGEGKYSELVGSVCVSVLNEGNLVEVAKVSGMTDEFRYEISLHPERFLGTVMEIATMGWGKDRLLHPRFKRHRPDANPKECTMGKMLAEMHPKELPHEPQRSFGF